jgi:hypothetical protein
LQTKFARRFKKNPLSFTQPWQSTSGFCHSHSPQDRLRHHFCSECAHGGDVRFFVPVDKAKIVSPSNIV